MKHYPWHIWLVVVTAKIIRLHFVSFHRVFQTAVLVKGLISWKLDPLPHLQVIYCHDSSHLNCGTAHPLMHH